MNAVDAIHNYITNKVDWAIYSIGNTTKQLISEVFGAEHITGTAEDASALADKIIKDNRQHVVFFCGDQRREELPAKLQVAQINLQEITVYHTVETAEKITKDYDGILFFSPSAVNSFFSVNKIYKDTVVFAIGRTTATAIKQYVNNNIIIADSPGKENLVKEMIAYFSTKN
jgi:uroporphyrinogen-III synthase